MTDYTELRRLAEAAQYENCEFQHELVAATKAFFVGCIPEQILALIAENERMSTNCLGVKLDVFEIVCAERDQLKAENERLSTENSEIESAAITYIEDMQEAQRENARLTELFTVGMTLDGNLRVYGDWQSVRKAQEILAERDQLRAEIAGLKTGYEAYERVNAELKAEVGALRKDAELHAQIQRAAGELPIGWEIRVCVEHESGYVELWDQDGCEVDFPNSCESLGLTVSDAIDAALGQGEQS